MIAITSDLVTNVDLIDEQHKELFKRINSVSSIGTKAYATHETIITLNFLGDYIVQHFNDEEELMLVSEYPEYKWHHTWHQGYILKFENLKEEFKKNGISSEYLQILDEFIIGWIVKHIGIVDVHLGKHINKYYEDKKNKK